MNRINKNQSIQIIENTNSETEIKDNFLFKSLY